jgi:uncharacterized membrane protein HdeD (DUF308 family)
MDEQVRKADADKMRHHIVNINLLSFTNAVAFPCLFFLLAIASSIFGRYDIESQNKSNWLLVVIAVISILCGIYFLVKTLKAIEEVSER